MAAAPTNPCQQCSAPLAASQRYCLECGARRGPLPRQVAGTLGTLLERGPVPAAVEEPVPEAGESTPGEARLPLSWRTPLGPKLPTPRVALAALMAMLAFGVALGSLGNVSVQTLASAPSILLKLPSAAFSSGSGAGGSGGGAGGGSTAAQQVQTVTVGSGSAPTPGSGAGTTASGFGGPASGSPTTGGSGGLPPVGHVFLIVLSQQGYNQTFGPGSANSYFSRTLAGRGELVQNYYAVGPSPLANEIALLSGQGPTQQTAANCPAYGPITPARPATDGQVIGSGCVYPRGTDTLPGQLTTAHKTWRAYIEGQPRACSTHAGTPSPEHPYAVWTNPLVFFDSIVRTKACRSDDVGLSQLKSDLSSAAKTPTLSYIAPSPCDDGSDQPCAPGAPAGLGPAEKFLKTILPELERSPAYKADGLIAITFDEAPQTGPSADSSSCCGNPTYPNLPAPSAQTTTTTTTTVTTTTTPSVPVPILTTPTTTSSAPTPTTPDIGAGESSPTGGGGQVGLLLISQYVKPRTIDPLDYFNHFSLLAGLEKMFGLKKLGYAKAPGLQVWTAAVFNAGGGVL